MVAQSRRDFLKKSIVGAGGLYLAGSALSLTSCQKKKATGFIDSAKGISGTKQITIAKTDVQFVREPLISPFGFKGGHLSELWQIVVRLESDFGNHAIGLGVQSVLWSDSHIFSSYSESGGNTLMYALTVRALQMIEGISFSSPILRTPLIVCEIRPFQMES